MNITNIELFQALVESIGVITCLISAAALTYHGIDKTTAELRKMFLFIAIMLVCDGCAYIFRGNTDTLSLVMTRLSNYGNFLMYISLFLASGRLVRATQHVDNPSVKTSKYLKIVYSFAAVATMILAFNPFTDFMFSFDAGNYYHRNTGWYVFTVIILIGQLISIFYILSNIKTVGTALSVTMIIYELAPSVLTVVQTLYYGISISALGIAIGIIIIMYSYFFSVEAARFTSKNRTLRQKIYPLRIYTAIILLIVCMSAAYFACINSFCKAFVHLGYEEDGYYILQTIFPSLIVFYAGIVIMLGLFILMFDEEWRSRRESEQNRMASILDELTGALNRRAYEQQVEKGLDDDENRQDFTVLMCDINGLKTANDVLGHKAGDDLIKEAAECIRTVFEKYGNVYRIGGDEFAVLIHCKEEQLEAALGFLDQLCSNRENPNIKELSISKGCARAIDFPEKDIGELVKVADQRMYADKDAYYLRTGKNRRSLAGQPRERR